MLGRQHRGQRHLLQQEMMFSIWTVAFSLLGAVKGYNLCYDDAGCVSSNPPYGGTPERPLILLPPSPRIIYKLYTSKNFDHHQPISASNESTITNSNYNSLCKTTIIIHGYLESTAEPWMKEMCQALINQDNCTNCILVDWSSMSSSHYAQAANIVIPAGMKVGKLIKKIMDTFNINGSFFHIIGHSLGAHIAGHAGKNINGICRVTGLDPAGIYFTNTGSLVRLDKEDANFVDIIHTDANPFLKLGLGIMENIGHMDFQPNGGKQMTECSLHRLVILPPYLAFCLLNPVIGPINCSETAILQNIECPKLLNVLSLPYRVFMELLHFVGCNHMQSIRYYIYSISHPEEFTSYPCESKEHYEAGDCEVCPSEGCPKMGHYARPVSHGTATTSYYLRTALPKLQVAEDVLEIVKAVVDVVPLVGSLIP